MKRPFDIIIWEGFWTIEDCRKNPDWLFVFGDNIQRIGNGGQAIIRDESNAIGLVTKVMPRVSYSAYMNDHEYWHNIINIDIDMAEIIHVMLGDKYKTLVLSSGGYGTGLAKLPEKAPKTFEYLNKRLLELFDFDNINGVLV